MVATSNRQTQNKKEKKLKTNLKMEQLDSAKEMNLPPKEKKSLLESPLIFRENSLSSTRNQEGPTTNGRKAKCQKHLFRQIKSNKNWHNEDVTEKLKHNRNRT